MILIDIFIRLVVVIFFILEGIILYSTYRQDNTRRKTGEKPGKRRK